MGKRSLSKQQQTRIRANRTGRSSSQPDSLEATQKGRVVARFGDQAEVEASSTDGKKIWPCHLRANLQIDSQHSTSARFKDGVVTGDFVHWSPITGEDMGVITEVLPRESVLLRPDIRGKLRLVASNIERICILIAPLPEPHFNLVDRYIVAAEYQQIKPVLICNKTDLLKRDEKTKLQQRFGQYQQLGYETFMVSAHLGEGVETLAEFLNNKTSIFVGQSGVGKSSLLKALHPDFDDAIGALSTAKSQKTKGKHTTTASRLYHLPTGGSVIDSPGIREFGLWHLEPQVITEGFIEIYNEAQHCRFRDCQHRTEPDCAVLSAVLNGKISQERLDSYRHILTSLETT